MGLFHDLDLLPPDPILGLTAAFNADPRPHKIDLSVGIYRNDHLKPEIMKAVARAERELLSEQKEKTYQPIEGHKGLIEGLKRVIFGDEIVQTKGAAIVGAQGIGGTGALRIGLDFLHGLGFRKLYLSDPTWANHHKLGKAAGYEVYQYPYYDSERQTLDFNRTFDFFQGLPEKSAVLLHGCCHNPTGADFSFGEWKELSALFAKRGLFPFFDLAYQGFGVGIEEDAAGIRHFVSEGHELIVAQSCSKNFGLYGERVGSFYVVTESPQVAVKTLSHVKPCIRANYSNPPIHGAAIVGKILGSTEMEAEWRSELEHMRQRIRHMRGALTEQLNAKTEHRFAFLHERHGLFSFTGLSAMQVEAMIRDHAIYMTSDGRINVCGLNATNLPIVVNAICQVLG